MSSAQHSRLFLMKERVRDPIHGRTWCNPVEVCSLGALCFPDDSRDRPAEALHRELLAIGRRCKAHRLRKAAARRLAEAGGFCKRDRGHYRAQGAGRSRALYERGGPGAAGETGDPAAVRKPKWQTARQRSGNSTDEALEINSLAWKMALPREAGNSNKINGLAAGANRHSSNILFSVRCRHAPGPSGPMM